MQKFAKNGKKCKPDQTRLQSDVCSDLYLYLEFLFTFFIIIFIYLFHLLFLFWFCLVKIHFLALNCLTVFISSLVLLYKYMSSIPPKSGTELDS